MMKTNRGLSICPRMNPARGSIYDSTQTVRLTRNLGPNLQNDDRHQSLNTGSMHPPQTQGKVQSAVRLALSGIYLLQASALTGLIDCQKTSKGPEKFFLSILDG